MTPLAKPLYSLNYTSITSTCHRLRYSVLPMCKGPQIVRKSSLPIIPRAELSDVDIVHTFASYSRAGMVSCTTKPIRFATLVVKAVVQYCRRLCLACLALVMLSSVSLNNRIIIALILNFVIAA